MQKQKLKYFKYVNYENYRGGVNNLQVVEIYTINAFGIETIVKMFTSLKNKAIDRADAWIAKQ